MKKICFLAFLLILTACTISDPGIYSNSFSIPSTKPTNKPIENNNVPTENNQQNITEKQSTTFPYDLIPDILSLSTCHEHSSPYNNLKLSSYDMGLKLSQNFKSQHQINRQTNPNEIVHLIQNSYQNVYPMLSVRNPSYNFYAQYINIGLFPFVDQDIIDFLSKNPNKFIQHTKNNQKNSPSIAASLDIDGLHLFNLLKQYKDQKLTLTYHRNIGLDDSQNPPIANSLGNFYGRSYTLTTYEPYDKALYLTNIKEVNLSTNQQEGRWICPKNWRIPIHRSENANSSFNKDFNYMLKNLNRYKSSVQETLKNLHKEAYCDTIQNPALSSNEKAFFYSLFRTSHSAHWPVKLGKTVLFIDKNDKNKSQKTNQTCIVYKNKACYKKEKPDYRIEFNEVSDCTHRYNQPNPEEQYKICPAFLSACYRK